VLSGRSSRSGDIDTPDVDARTSSISSEAGMAGAEAGAMGYGRFP
jgi:hypothetical protein